LPLGPVAYILALRFYPNNLAFEIGQLQLLLGLIFLLACFATLCDRQMLAGSLLSIFAITKPQFVPFALLAACRRNWRFVYGFVFLLSGLMVSSVLLYGWRNNLAYLDVLSFLSRHGEWQHLNQSVGGFLNRLFYHGPSLDRDPKGLITQSAFPPYSPFVYYPTLLTTIILTAIPFLIRARSGDKISQLAAFCLAGVAFTMASPIAWVHHYNVLLPAYAVTWKAILDRWDGKVAHITLFLLATSLILVGYPIVPADAWTDPAQNVIQSHVFWGACLLLVLLIAVNLSAPTVHRSAFDIGSDAKTS
jgi:hypothetical protein